MITCVYLAPMLHVHVVNTTRPGDWADKQRVRPDRFDDDFSSGQGIFDTQRIISNVFDEQFVSKADSRTWEKLEA